MGSGLTSIALFAKPIVKPINGYATVVYHGTLAAHTEFTGLLARVRASKKTPSLKAVSNHRKLL